LVLALVAAGCGSGSPRPPAGGDQTKLREITWSAPSSGQRTSCSIVAGDTEIIVAALMHDVSRACPALLRGLSSHEQHWADGSLRTTNENGLPIQFTVACALANTIDDEQVTVVSPSGEDRTLGTGVCSRFASAKGWRRRQTGTTTTLASAGY
jgi:hypothetical protein